MINVAPIGVRRYCQKRGEPLMRTFVDGAANGGSEPIVTDAAACMSGCLHSAGDMNSAKSDTHTFKVVFPRSAPVQCSAG